MGALAPELRHKGVTLQLLWFEHRDAHANGYQYSRVCDRYQEWRGRFDVVLRQRTGAMLSSTEARRYLAIASSLCPGTAGLERYSRNASPVWNPCVVESVIMESRGVDRGVRQLDRGSCLMWLLSFHYSGCCHGST